MFDRVLNMPGFWVCQVSEYTRVLNMPRFSIYHDSEYAFCSVYARVLNMPGLQRVLKMPMLCLCLNMFEYARICVNIPSSVWMAFVLNFFIVISLGCFPEEKNLNFPKAAESIWFAFGLRLNIFASKISNLLLSLRTERLGTLILIHRIYIWWFLMIYLSTFLLLLFVLLIFHFLVLQRT